MRGRVASIAAAVTLLVLLIFFVSVPSPPASSLFRRPSRPVSGNSPYKGWPDPLPWNPPRPKDASEGNAERLIVKVKLESEDASWTQKLEPSWKNNIITVESMYSHSHPKAHRLDKGRVASAYLTWIIENYNNLPETTILIPPRDKYEQHHLGFHNTLLNLKIPFVQESGFANLRCPKQKSQSTCNDKVLKPAHPPHEFRTLEAKIPKVWQTLFGNHTEVPQQIATVLGSTFAVSKAQVQKKSVDDYVKYWTWLNKTIMDDDSSGLLMEYIWPIVFGKEAIFCPEPLRAITTQGIVVVEVGPDSVRYHVHKALLIHHSEYFRRALTGPWKEAQEQVIILLEVEPLTFNIFVQWLYTQELPQDEDDWVALIVIEKSTFWKDDLMHALIKAYVFGDCFLAPEFRRAVNNASAKNTLSEYYIDEDGQSTITYAFENIPAESVVLQRLVDVYCIAWSDGSADHEAHTLDLLPSRFLRRVMKRMQELGRQSLFHIKTRCYLEHASDEEKEECDALHMRYDEKVDLAYFE